MPKVTEEYREEMRRRIVDAALICFARKGFSGASMADIVAEAGLSAGAVYLYYQGKNELLVGVSRTLIGDGLSAIDVAMGEDEIPPPDVVVSRVLSRLPGVPNFPEVAVQVWGEAVRNDEVAVVGQEILGHAMTRVAAYLEAWFQSTGASPDDARRRAEVVAPAVAGLVQAGFVRRGIFRITEDHAYIAGVSELLRPLR